MEFRELISKRYSCKKYSDKKVEKELVEKIIEAGRMAPTAKNLQPQKIYVLQSEEALAKMDAVTPCRYGASTVLAVGFDKSDLYTYPGGKYTSGTEDATIVATHMILAAADLGVDSCWINRFDPDEFAASLGLDENVQLVMLMDLGYAAEGTGPLQNHDLRKDIAGYTAWL